MFAFLQERYHNVDSNLKLALVRFIFSLGTASAATVWSLYMHHIGFSNSTVGYITGGVALFSIVLLLISTPVLEFFRARRIFVASLVLYIAMYAFIAITVNKLFSYFSPEASLSQQYFVSKDSA